MGLCLVQDPGLCLSNYLLCIIFKVYRSFRSGQKLASPCPTICPRSEAKVNLCWVVSIWACRSPWNILAELLWWGSYSHSSIPAPLHCPNPPPCRPVPSLLDKRGVITLPQVEYFRQNYARRLVTRWGLRLPPGNFVIWALNKHYSCILGLQLGRKDCSSCKLWTSSHR